MSESLVVPSRFTAASLKAYEEWVDGLPDDVRDVARVFPMTTCYRHKENPRWHYTIHSYSPGRLCTLVHGRDSTLPGVLTFGQSVDPLIKCDCGKWEPPTQEQVEERRRSIERFQKRGRS